MLNIRKDHEYWNPSRKGFVTNYPNFHHWKKSTAEEVLDQKPINVYVHIPFCIQRCAYCYYKTINLRGNNKEQKMGRYVDALCKEIELTSQYFNLKNRPVISIYFGGGTPTLLTEVQLEQVVQCLRKNLNIQSCEFTMEGEPVTFTKSKAQFLDSLNVTRISLGIQSFNDEIIKQANRLDTAKKALKSVDIAMETGKIVNIDLMSGLAGETMDSWRDSVEKALSTNVQSITVYKTELYSNTSYYRGIRNNTLELPSDDVEIEYTKYAIRRLEEEGYKADSFTTFTRQEDYDHVHAPDIFRGGDCVPFGVSAFGRLGDWVFQNTNNEEKYIEHLNKGQMVIHRGYNLTSLDNMIRNVVLEMKLIKLDLIKFKENHGFNLLKLCAKTIEQLERDKIITVSDQELKLTSKGMLLGDYAGKSLVKCLMEMY